VEKLLKRQYDPSIIGLLQALGVAVYCPLIGGFISVADKIFPKPGFFGIFLMLILLVFSAAITGSLVFGYPAYLALNKKVKEALYVLAYTLGYSLAIILIIILVLTNLYQVSI
jgi:hypothetical protein